MFGLLFSLKDLVNSFSQSQLDVLEREPFHSYATDEYKLHYFETATGLRFVLTTDPKVGRKTELLKAVYRKYIDTWVKSPFYRRRAPIDSAAFAEQLDALLSSQSISS